MDDQLKRVLLLSGGGHAEHDISVISAKHIQETLKDTQGIEIIHLELNENGEYKDNQTNKLAIICSDGKILTDNKKVKIDYAIPCFHGYPGESGDMAALLDLSDIPYLGQKSEQSSICFNKITTKLWLTTIGINNSPYVAILNSTNLDEAKNKFTEWKDVFVKAASQGSSVGCYHVTDQEKLEEAIINAFEYSDQVIMEKRIKGRELEISVYEYEDKLIASCPGEIILPENEFYSYEEKYSNESSTSTVLMAEGISPEVTAKMKDIAIKAFINLGLRHLSRVDFFLTEDDEIILNEINTFPGLTPISMFPKMMEASGDSFKKFLVDQILG